MDKRQCCQTKFPILLLHGLNCRAEKPIAYFGRIPDALRNQGAKVYLGEQDAWGTIENNALQIKKQLDNILMIEKCDKVNIVAHSKGGLEARYLVSGLMQQDQIASISTISTPHYGSKTAQRWVVHDRLLTVAGTLINLMWKMIGDKKPDFMKAVHSLTPKAMLLFNAYYPDASTVYYQSWGASLSDSQDDFIMDLAGRIFCRLDGETDGLVSPQSAKWGNYHGTIERISHRDVVDCRKRDYQHFSATDFHIKLVNELAEKGF